MNKILYISYDGILDPLGQSQVISYLKKISINQRIFLISYEKDDKYEKLIKENLIMRLKDEFSIIWYPLKYRHKFGIISKLINFTSGLLLLYWLVLINNINIIHARSYIPAIMSLVIKMSLRSKKIIFDIRGFWFDERMEAGLWNLNNFNYRLVKKLESFLFIKSDHIVTLTNISVPIINNIIINDQQKKIPISVISTCVDFKFFHLQDTNIKQKKYFVVGYVGSVGTWQLFDEVIKAFLLLLNIKKNCKLVVINSSQHDYIFNRIDELKLDRDFVDVFSSEYVDINRHIINFNVGIFFYKKSFSRIACSPTKLGEFLACGIPCICNDGIGDTTNILKSANVGVVVDSFEKNIMLNAFKSLINLEISPDIRLRCNATAVKYFSLNDGVNTYNSIYKSL